MNKLLHSKKLHFFVVRFSIVFALAIFVCCTYCAGWRITYNPELENSWNWDAVSAIAAWAGVAASAVAIWYAVRVPKKIADRQDKIALFERRYDCYSLIQSLLVCARQMEPVLTKRGIKAAFGMYLDSPEMITENESAAIFATRFKQKQAVIVSGEFLFQNYNTELLQEIIDTGVSLILASASPNIEETQESLSNQAISLKKKYCRLCQQYEDIYIELMEQEMRLIDRA